MVLTHTIVWWLHVFSGLWFAFVSFCGLSMSWIVYVRVCIQYLFIYATVKSLCNLNLSTVVTKLTYAPLDVYIKAFLLFLSMTHDFGSLDLQLSCFAFYLCSQLVSWTTHCLSASMDLGSIGVLQQYTWDKQLETLIKSSGILGGPKTSAPTVISPLQYKRRFRKAMSNYFLTVPGDWPINSLSVN